MCSVCRRSAKESGADLADFINERWKGMYPVGWGATLAEGEFVAKIYQDLCGLDKFAVKK